jgi:hypothetical protein
LDLCGSQVYLGGLQVGFVLNALELEAIEINLGDGAGFVTVAVYIQDMVVVSEVFPGEVKDSFLLKGLDEGAT